MTSPVVECFRCHTPIPGNSRFCLSCGADVSGGDGLTSTSSVDIVRERLQRIIEGKYRLERLLGKGGMGQVFLAHDLTLEREVAIKVLPPDVAQDDQVVRRFQQEAKTAAKLDHPNIIPIYRVESEGGLNYFVMKYISGTSLEDLLDKKEPLPVPEIQRILWEAACALGHAHQRGVVHRDVKPANIMFDHDGRVMLTDFGISKALQAATGLTATGMIIGTPHYMAPEQGKGGAVDGRADQYSLGVVGYRMITGAPTTPLPAAKARRRRSRAPVVIGLVVVAAGVGGYLMLGREETAPRSPLPAPSVDTVRIQDTVRVPVPRRPAPAKPREQALVAVAQGFLTIAADPFGEVYIDGVDAGQTPLVEYAVRPGRHTIRIEHAGFKTITVTVQVDASNTVRKRYTLLPE